MSLQKEEIRDNHVIADYSHEYSIFMDRKYSKVERLAVVKSYTDRLKLTLDDIRNHKRLNSLSIIPPDLIPFDVNLVDGNKVTILETDPVVTFYDGELTNIEGDIIHIHLRNEGEELDEDFHPTKRVCSVRTADSLEKILPSIINDLVNPEANKSQVSIKPGTSNTPSMPCNAHSEGELLKKNNGQQDHENCNETNNPKQKTNDDTSENLVVFKPESPCPEVDSSSSGESIETISKKDNTPGDETLNQVDNGQRSDVETSPFSSKFQVIGLLDMGTVRDSGSEEGLHNTVEDFDNKERLTRKETTTMIVDKELGNQSKFMSVSLKKPPAEQKKIMPVRKSTRAHKPKIRSHFKSWDDLKIRLPRNRRKRTSKVVANQS